MPAHKILGQIFRQNVIGALEQAFSRTPSLSQNAAILRSRLTVPRRTDGQSILGLMVRVLHAMSPPSIHNKSGVRLGRENLMSLVIDEIKRVGPPLQDFAKFVAKLG